MSVKMIPLKKDESLELILKHNSNLIPVLLNFHGRILEYNHDTRMGTISVVNKLILTITLYTF